MLTACSAVTPGINTITILQIYQQVVLYEFFEVATFWL